MTTILERDGWQHIETAPKSGECFVALQFGRRPCVMHRDTVCQEFVRTVTCNHCYGDGLEGLTHWLPLPKLPDTEEEAWLREL